MKKLFKEFISFAKLLLIFYVILSVITGLIFSPVVVKGSSMQPTLHDGDIGLSYIITKKLLGLHADAVVTIYIPDEKQYIVKRVIGLPGDVVYASEGKVYVNDQAIEEEYLDTSFKAAYEESSGRNFTEDFPKVKVPEGHYFVLGDNRPNSLDSRFYGPFANSAIKSNSLFILYPFSNFGIR